jgi:hypothetical protein
MEKIRGEMVHVSQSLGIARKTLDSQLEALGFRFLHIGVPRALPRKMKLKVVP